MLGGVAMLQAGGLSLWPTLGAIKWQGDYQAALATPLTTSGLVIGHILWIGFRITVSATVYLLVLTACLLYTSPSPRDRTRSRMPSSA